MSQCKPGMGVCGVALLLASSVALAEDRPLFEKFELERLDLNPGAAGSLLIGTGELLPAGDFRFSSVAHYQHNPFVVSRSGKATPIVGSRATMHLVAAYAPFSWLELGAQLPVVMLQTGANLTEDNIAQPASRGLSTPTVSARVGLLSQQAGSWGDFALEMGVGPPVGSAPGFARDAGLRYAPRLMFGRHFGWFRVALESRFVVRPKVDSYDDQDSALARDTIGSEAQMGLALAMIGQRTRWELDLRASIPLEKQPSSVELFLGPRYLLNPSVEFFALAGLGSGTAPGTPLFRVLFGASFGRVVPPRLPDESSVTCSPELDHTAEECPDMDEDGDGVPNGQDMCDDDAGTPERQGCPWTDIDKDGIEDKLDACPAEVGVAAWKGCPMPDADKDGIEDGRDVCPSEPGPELSRGCPLKDRDHDEVEDDVDQCPDLAGPKDRQGCPESDLDRDNIPNVLDTCAKAAGPAENHGCPSHEVPLVWLTRQKIELMEKIFFVPGQPRIDSRSFPTLEWAAKVITEHPDLPLIVVGAHTDDRGSAVDNLRQSQARAEAVRQYLIQHGVAPDKLEAKGYGQSRPIDSNATSIGRENNRRIEFVIVARQ
ncbi:OmpA family protein [Hyalangium versicolor]|uniref:OmpA family protein n=1 Tax=Hyalangium versicolor TaxID=2861190 RepID=UPI001CCD2965|nr:OmpA family protein [Hyalangium versicolor]